MIWFFDRDGETLRYEISRDKVDGRYRVVITRPDGSESVEEVDEPTELIERSVELMNSLRGDGWRVAERRSAQVNARTRGKRSSGGRPSIAATLPVSPSGAPNTTITRPSRAAAGRAPPRTSTPVAPPGSSAADVVIRRRAPFARSVLARCWQRA